ncbi:MAG TPA: ParB/RepB/Spo0J family partition protein [Firmicutes bacterium]|nr:ParB/RepB/Spo0J family partition protein [Bacillota bacterium]
MAKLLGLGEQSGSEVREIPLASIHANPFQPRREFSEEELLELAASIEAYGVLQPVLVRPRGQGFELVAGERRVRACRLLHRATIPALVRALNDQDVALLGMLENLQRQDLSFWEEAEGYARLLSEFGLTQEELAQRLGKSQSTIANKLRLLRLPDSIRKHISREILTERHARALLRLPDASTQEKLAQRISTEHLTVQQTEELVARFLAAKEERAPRPRVLRVYKDIRLFLNSVRKAAGELQKAGLEVAVSTRETEAGWEVQVLIPRQRQEKGTGGAKKREETRNGDGGSTGSEAQERVQVLEPALSADGPRKEEAKA